MRRLMTTILVMTSTAAFAGGEDAAILKVHDDFAANWNKHDYKAMSAMFADDADLIALATRGRGGLARLFRGSVADRVIRGASVPVLVYRPDTAQAGEAIP